MPSVPLAACRSSLAGYSDQRWKHQLPWADLIVTAISIFQETFRCRRTGSGWVTGWHDCESFTVYEKLVGKIVTQTSKILGRFTSFPGSPFFPHQKSINRRSTFQQSTWSKLQERVSVLSKIHTYIHILRPPSSHNMHDLHKTVFMCTLLVSMDMYYQGGGTPTRLPNIELSSIRRALYAS